MNMLITLLRWGFLICASGACLVLCRRYAQRTYKHWGTSATVEQQEHNNPSLPSESLKADTGNQVIAVTHARTPFVFKPPQNTSDAFHIREKIQEPNAYLNATNATVWMYGNIQDISALFLAGHANPQVCKQISALLYNTFLTMEDIADAVFVPGACFLREKQDAARIPTLFLPRRSLFRREPSRLEQLVGNLQPFQNEIGLVVIQEIQPEAEYHRILKTLQEQMHQVYQAHAPVLLKSSSNQQTAARALFLPFFRLAEPGSQITLQLTKSLLTSADFEELQKIHAQALLEEMKADALRRQRIYQKWLREDEEHQEQYRWYYFHLSEEERNAQNVLISGTRDYINAKTTQPDEHGQEVYKSPREYYEDILPGLLQEDQVWIDKMEELLKSLNERDPERDQRLQEMNLAILLDSFLRGWASVFLEGKEARACYERWCQQMRPLTWRAIYNQLTAQGVRIEPFLEENIIFQVQSVRHDTVRITPLHLTTDQDLLAYLDPDYGVTYYLNRWSRRTLITRPVPDGQTHLQLAQQYYHAGAQWLDAPSETDSPAVEEAIQRGSVAFRSALEATPLIVQDIWDGWWARFSRDTSADFEKFKDLIRGVHAYYEADYVRSSECLTRFLANYPEHLPDPYMLLAIQTVQHRAKIEPLRIEYQQKIDAYNTCVKEYNAKLEFLRSNKDLERTLREKHSWLTPLEKHENQKLKDINRIREEVATLQAEMRRLDERIIALDVEIRRGMRVVWDTLRTHPDEYLKKAEALAPEYVQDVFKKRFTFTPQSLQCLQQTIAHDLYARIQELEAQQFSNKEYLIETFIQALTHAIGQEHAVQYTSWIEHHIQEYENSFPNIEMLASLSLVAYALPYQALTQLCKQIAQDLLLPVNELKEQEYATEEELKEALNKMIQQDWGEQYTEFFVLYAEQTQFFPSDVYRLGFGALHTILQADEYIAIARKLYEESDNLGKQKSTVAQFTRKIDACLKAEYLSEKDLQELRNFREKLHEILPQDHEISVIVREMILKKEAEQLAKACFHEGESKYEQYAPRVPQFTEPIQRLTGLYAEYRLGYRQALRYMFSKAVPLRNFAPQGVFMPATDQKLKITQVWCDRAQRMIVGRDKTGETFNLVQVENLTDEEFRHLEQEVRHPQFLRQYAVGVNSAEQMLNRTITPSPCSQRWSRALQTMEPELIRLMAYLYLSPLPRQPRLTGAFRDKLENQPVVNGVATDEETIRTAFFREIGVTPANVAIVSVDL